MLFIGHTALSGVQNRRIAGVVLTVDRKNLRALFISIQPFFGLVNVKTLKTAFNAVVTDITALYTALKGLGVPLVQTSASLSDNIEDNSIKH